MWWSPLAGLLGPARALYLRLGENLAEEGIGVIRVHYRRPGIIERCLLDAAAAADLAAREEGRRFIFLPPSDHPWETETCWFAFCVPERNLMGYLYTWIRPNLGIAGGGTLVWDDTAYLPWEVPFFDYNHSIPLPEGLDLRDATLPTGMRVKVIEPLTSYELGYRYPYGDMFEAELRFDALTPPHVFTRGEPPFTIASHIDPTIGWESLELTKNRVMPLLAADG